jgi:chlorobactene glucosyltransferase
MLLTILSSLLWFIVFAWILSTVLTLYGLSRRKILPTLNDSRLKTDDVPLVSVLVPARNEADRVLALCLRSILKQDYGCFEVIAVDDRSTDTTATTLESIAREDSRLRVIVGREPPDGWLGKPFAMHQALADARGEWILATDADMIFDPRALRTAMVTAMEREADALTCIPHFEAVSFWERLMIPTWAWVLLMFSVSYRTNNPKSQGAVGIGGFFLMRRSILKHVGDYEGLKDEVMEDVRLAEKIKRSQKRIIAVYAPQLLSTRMYRNFNEMWECCTKNWFSGMNFSLSFAMSCVLMMYLIAVVPSLVALVSAIGIATGTRPDLWQVFIPAVLSWLMQVVVLMIMSVRSEVHPVYALTAPLGLAVLYAMLFDSSFRITLGKGVRWKGRKIYEHAGVRPPQLTGASWNNKSFDP